MSRPKLAEAEMKSKEGEMPPSRALQQLWFSMLKREWSSLVIVPSHPGGSAKAVAKALVDMGRLHRGEAIKLLEAENLQMVDTSKMVIEMTSHVSGGGRVIVSLDSVIKSQAGIPLALAADGAILCVELGEADFASARETIELIGQARVLGCVTLPGVGK